MKKHLPQLITFIFILNSIIVLADDIDTADVSLFDRSIEELIDQEVTIASKTSQKLSQTPSIVSVVTAEEIKTMGYRELEEVLETIPGFVSGQTRLGSPTLAIRGVDNYRQGGRLLILLDGTPYNDVMYGSSLFFGATFDLDAVERIEVIRGPGSALYGRNAFSGVINIITKKAESNNHIEMGSSYGSYNTFDISASYGMKKDEFNAKISTKYFTTDGTDSKYNNGEGGESIWNLKHDNIYLNANAEYKNFQFYGSYYNRIDGLCTGIPVGDFVTNGSTEFRVGTYSLSYNKNLASNSRLNAKLYGRNEYRFQDYELTTPNTTDSVFNPFINDLASFNTIYTEGMYAEPVFDAYTYGAEIEMNFQLHKNNRLLTGIQGDIHGIKNASVRTNYSLEPLPLPLPSLTNQYSREEMPTYAPGWIRNGGHDYVNVGIYAQDAHTFMDLLTLTLGGRLDYDSEVGFILNPRAALVIEPTDFASIKLLYGKAYRAPTTNEQYKIMGADMGNDSLNHEVINTIELATSLNFNKFYTQVSFYYNKLADIILSLDVDNSPNVKSYYNQGKNTSYGFEIEAKYKINKSLYTFGNYSYTQSEDSRSSINGTIKNPHANIAKHIVNLGVNTRILKKLNWSILLRYVGPMEKFRSDNTINQTEYISQDVVGDYTMLNSTILFSDIFKGFDISIQGYNLLNQEYYFQDDVFSNQPKQQGRHYLLRASYNFNL